MAVASDTDQGVIAGTTPANPFVPMGIQPGDARTFSQTVAVNYLGDPTRRDWAET
jgi:hypothetical protein